ncbi:phage tail protein I [Salmonella enterica]|nr:phage tail protein I [Salmonella enterica]
MSDSRLLPTGSSPLEVAAAKACAEIEKTPVSIRELWNPDTCPANLLPWLAWSFSVDRWDDKWPEATKRAVIRDAYFIHCHTGRADIYTETPVKVSGFKRVIDEQDWTITKVTHFLNNSGFTTSLELEVRLSDVEYETEDNE